MTPNNIRVKGLFGSGFETEFESRFTVYYQYSQIYQICCLVQRFGLWEVANGVMDLTPGANSMDLAHFLNFY